MTAPARRSSSHCQPSREAQCEASREDRRHIVFVVDDDASIREALSSLIRSIGLRIEAFASARGFLPRVEHPAKDERMAGRQFLRRKAPDAPACLVLDVRLRTAHERDPVKIQRGQMMRKMKAASLADLVRMAEKLRSETAS